MVSTTKRLLLLLLTTICWCCGGYSLNAQTSILPIATSISINLNNDSLKNLVLQSVDGPYLFRDKKGNKLVRVVQNAGDYQILEEYIDKQQVSIQCVVDNDDKDIFTIPLMEKIRIPKPTYKKPEKLLAISDIEGNFNSFYSLLLSNGVMDKNFNWIYGKGHLVLVGDFMDRGINVTQVLWLIYKLEQEAKKAGGFVHFILGNHEILNLEGKTNYVDKKYIKLAKKFSGKADDNEAYLSLMAKNQELVRWMKSKNSVEKIGDILFVHGGISPELVNAGFTMDRINNTIRGRLRKGPSRDEKLKMDEDFLMASHGPLWYRGLATRYRNFYKKATAKDVQKALKHFRVNYISIGHTIAKKVCTDYEGRVIRTDVKHSCFKNDPTSQGLLVSDGKLFRVDALGKKYDLNPMTTQ